MFTYNIFTWKEKYIKKKSSKQFKSVESKNKLNIEDVNQMLKIYRLQLNFVKKLFYFM